MSVASLWREALQAIADVIKGLLGWILVAPLSALMPKRKDWICVVGREDGRFIDNTKYFFIHATAGSRRDLRVVHVSERVDVVSDLSERGFQSILYPSLRAVWFMVRCGNVVVDSIEWHQKYRFFLLSRARVIQLWHGVGFKRIELEKWRNEADGKGLVSKAWLLWPRLARRLMSGRIPQYDAVVTTSRFYRDNVFSTAFRARHVIVTGYPRNDFSIRHDLDWINVDIGVRDSIARWTSTGRKIVLVAPTYRDSRATPLHLDEERIQKLEDFCETHGFELIFKFHPYERGAALMQRAHLHILSAHSDIYPLLPSIHAMVTDYSSIYMDFLQFNRPIHFLTPDLEEYCAKDRGFQFDYNEMTPGPKHRNWDSLLEALLEDDPSWAMTRRRLFLQAFDGNCVGATNKLLEFMTEKGWVPSIGDEND